MSLKVIYDKSKPKWCKPEIVPSCIRVPARHLFTVFYVCKKNNFFGRNRRIKKAYVVCNLPTGRITKLRIKSALM
jgi:hypothetical protein